MNLKFTPLTSFLGAEISGLDLHKAIEPDVAAELRDGLDRYSILLVRDQPLSTEEQAQYAEVFGNIDTRTIDKFGVPGAERAHYVSNTRPDGSLRTGELCFHNDQLFYEKPNRASLLHAIEIPSRGGETRYAHVACEYEAMSVAEQSRLENLTAYNIFDYAARGGGTQRVPIEELPAGTIHWTHPVLFQHPFNKRKTIWVARNNTIRILELPKDESDDLIESLCNRVSSSEFIYDHSWRVGDTMIWDNWMVQHARRDFNPVEPRTLRRIPVNARAPVSV
jgi:taurine dioxygenase